jgi:hypothetical protein
MIQDKPVTNPVGRPAKLFQCLKCKMVMSSTVVRKHKC